MSTNTVSKVLIVSHAFPPFHSMIGGMIRMIKLADFLRLHGYDVTVLSSEGPHYGYFGYEDVIGKLKTVYVRDPVKGGEKVANREGRVESVGGEGRISLWGKAVIRDLVVPDISVFSVPVFYRMAVKEIELNDIDNVIISSPPHSMQLVGVLLKRKFGDKINVISDYRDSWNCTPLFSKKNPLSRLVSRVLERRVLKDADKFLYVSRPMLAKINEAFFDISDKATLVMNGADLGGELPMPVSTARTSVDTVVIGYFGALNARQRAYRDPMPMFKAIRAAGLPFKVKMYGGIDCPDEWRQVLGDALDIEGSVTHQEAFLKMREMDLLVFFHTERAGSDEVVSGKIFDYILARRPILIVGPREMEAVRIVKEYSLGYWLDPFSSEQMEKGLGRIFDDWKGGRLPDLSTTDMSVFSRNGQYEKVIDLLRP